MNNNSIVVYHSEMERMQDEFWMDFMTSNASWLQYVYLVILALFFVSVVGIIFTVLKGLFSNNTFR